MTCICHREPRGFGSFDPDKKIGARSYTWFCSAKCLQAWDRITKKGKIAMSLTRDEVEAIRYASRKAGEYLDSIGKSDLSTMTEDEWMILNETIFVEGSNKLREIICDKEVPF